jgi:hypothetical protein
MLTVEKNYNGTSVEKEQEVEMPRCQLYCLAIAGDISGCGVGILLVEKRGRRLGTLPGSPGKDDARADPLFSGLLVHLPRPY